MSMKAKTTRNAKPSRKRSTATDLSAKNARSVMGGNQPTPAHSLSYSKLEWQYKR